MSVDTTTGEIVEPLTAMEQSRLVHAEATIERGLTSFLEVGGALSEVRDSRLYRATFGTFEAYCRERWNITDRRARQMIDAATTTRSLPTGTTVPTNEGQARELRGLEPEQADRVMRHADALVGEGAITANAIRLARQELYPKATKTPAPSPLGEEDGGAGQTSGPATPGDQRGEEPASPEIEDTDPGPETPEARPAAAPHLTSAPSDEFTEQDRAEELASSLAGHLSLLYALTNPERRTDYVRNWRLGTDHRPVLGQKYVTPECMRAVGDALHIFADEWEQANV